MKPIRVLFLAAEATPLVKVGGLGDVAGSLPRALKQLAQQEVGDDTMDIRLALPFHSAIREKVSDPEFLFTFEVPTRDGVIKAQAFQVIINDIHTYLIAGEPIGADSPVYSQDPAVDGMKYIFFSLAALEMVKNLDWQPDILHANDWHTAISVYALKLKKTQDPFYKKTRSVLTIHNLPFMGAGTGAAFDLFGLPVSRYPHLPWWARKFPLPLGLQTADRIVAVSQTYAQEILTPEFGCGLENFLARRRKVISGIVNGLDQDSWDPARDMDIAVNYDADSLARRALNRDALSDEFALDPDQTIPLLILISRMDPQKGVDIALQGLSRSTRSKWQAILLGTGDPQLEDACRQLEKKHPDRIRAAIRFDARLSRRMYAGADILLMPSRYEPCGLAQMMAMRYGCVPLARATGGLRDTIRDVDTAESTGEGFLFGPATPQAFSDALRRALHLYRNPVRWQAIQRNGMRQDFSWEKSAAKYLDLYRSVLSR